MLPSEIRSWLRGAVNEGWLSAWQGPFVTGEYQFGARYHRHVFRHDVDYTRLYCRLLEEAGVKPLPKPWDAAYDDAKH